MMGPFIPELEVGTNSSPGGTKGKLFVETSEQISSTSANEDEDALIDGSMEGVLSGFHFVWHSMSTLEAFVKVANELSATAASDDDVAATATPPTLAVPSWISQAPGSITPDTLRKDLLLHVAELGGGLQYEGQLITPNTPVQAYNICRRLGHVEMHPFMQACMAKLPADAHFVSAMRLFENPGMNACPVYFEPPPAPFRQMFF